MTNHSPPTLEFSAYRLSHLPRPLKIMLTGVLILLSGGLAAAVGHHYYAYRNADADPSLSYEDLRIALTGDFPPVPDTSVETTLLWQQVHGEMKQYLPRRNDFAIINAWLLRGHAEATYDWPWTIVGDRAVPAQALNAPPGQAPVATQGAVRKSPAEIFGESCVPCHNPGGERSNSPLTGYAAVSQYLTHPDPPPTRPVTTVAQVTRIAHAHWLTLPVLALLLAGFFYFADWPPGSPAGRAAITVLPVACLIVDAAGGWLALTIAPLAGVTVAARVGFLLTVAIQIVGTLGGIWQAQDSQKASA